MTSEQINFIANHPLFTIGAHGVTHASLSSIALEDATLEIRRSKKILQDICGIEIDAFAFPFGDYNEALIKLHKKFG